MLLLPRRRFLGLTAGALAAPSLSFAQAAGRPEITIAVQKLATSNTLDPLSEQSNVGTRIMNSYLECLIGQDLRGDLSPIPRLATAWTRIDDKTVELDLRRGVKFHNGDELTAEDVVFTFSPDRMMGDTTPEGWDKTISVVERTVTARTKELPPQVPAVARRLWPSLVKVEAVGDYKVRFINATPDVTMEGRIMALGSQIISRRAFEEAPSWLDFARAPVGTGPYKVEKLDPDTELVLVSHDDYWGGLPPLKRIRFVQVPEAAQRVNGVRAGQYDMACDLTPDQFAQVESDTRLEVVGGIINNIRVTCFDKHDTALVDPRVRQAMLHAIDRQMIVDQLWMGKTVVPKGDQFKWYGDMYLSDWAAPEYDPAKSRQLLKEAGYKGDAIPYRLLNDYYTLQVNNAQVMVEMWKQVGLNVEIEMKENWSQVWDPNGTRGVHDWSSGGSFPDPVATQPNQWGPQGQAVQTGEYGNDEVNTLCGVLQTSTDKAARRKAFQRMLVILEREDPAYGVINQNATFTAKSKSMGWQVSPSFAMDFRPGNWS
ncbi:ABC transporter substrate-binding protein [Pseudooceanicola sp. CBS1P-1]|uniref:ABC transporter substrate-binding protein n=1 Tax=Pseudooceanicola albus TaxID=2692189 RepID=A0A6L7G0A5_9RHOB|nr:MULTISPECIES: ABC transporter substrate-binding protein [Pseudooceanicola]MBT9382334.1 ABC transporter substrate-binding protein [Pseudooceanicola endophyticus]MXN16876.1 ABC transporter substrate-binding protein [Pseudooceanicola albus]